MGRMVPVECAGAIEELKVEGYSGLSVNLAAGGGFHGHDGSKTGEQMAI